MEKENFILKKIRYYQATIADYETFWDEKIKESESEISDETKELKNPNSITIGTIYVLQCINCGKIKEKVVYTDSKYLR